MYMFSKALYFSDARSCTLILRTTDPKTQKKLGQAVKNFNDYKWTRVKARVAWVGNWYKFMDPANKDMRTVLLGTQGKDLAEAARRDRVRGIGYNAEEAERYRGLWGENLLGRALMVVRKRVGEMERRETGDGRGIGGMDVGWGFGGGRARGGGEKSSNKKGSEAGRQERSDG